MTADELISTINDMNPSQVREFGQALERCGVSVVLTKRLTTDHIAGVAKIAFSKSDLDMINKACDDPQSERRPWIDTYEDYSK